MSNLTGGEPLRLRRTWRLGLEIWYESTYERRVGPINGGGGTQNEFSAKYLNFPGLSSTQGEDFGTSTSQGAGADEISKLLHLCESTLLDTEEENK